MGIERITKYQFFNQLKNLSFIEEIWLFGSRARGDEFERSDIDIAILCPYAKDSEWLQVLEILDNADTLLKIDCIRLDNLPSQSPLLVNIIRDGIKLYVKNKT